MARTKASLGKTPRSPPAAYPIKPLTTQGKILKAKKLAEKRKQNVPREAPAAASASHGSSVSSSTASSKKKSKAKSFAPPDEIDEAAQEVRQREVATARRLATRSGKWDFTKNKPITTQQKLFRAKAIQQSKGGLHAALSEKASKLAAASAQPSLSLGILKDLQDASPGGCQSQSRDKHSNVKGEKRRSVPGLYTIMQHHSASIMTIEPVAAAAESVLVRATEKAKSQRGKSQAPGIFVAIGSKNHELSVLGLPQSIRARIWRYAVVEENFFIWPTLRTGREQPDLAMTCRAIRAEVLPMYYGLNTFAVMISPEMKTPETWKMRDEDENVAARKKPLSGLAAVYRWTAMIADAGWFSHVTHWAFDYDDSESIVFEGNCVQDTNDQSFVVSLNLNGPSRLPVQSCTDRHAAISRVDKVEVQVHREGSCILPGWQNCGRCLLKPAPQHAVDAVAKLFGQTNGSEPGRLQQLVECFRDMTVELQKARCSR